MSESLWLIKYRVPLAPIPLMRERATLYLIGVSSIDVIEYIVCASYMDKDTKPLYSALEKKAYLSKPTHDHTSYSPLFDSFGLLFYA